MLEDRFGALPSWVEKRVCEEMFPEHSERLILRGVVPLLISGGCSDKAPTE